MTTLQDPPVLVGSTTPRLWTPPLVTGPSGSCGCGCPLSPATSLGFQAVEFAQGVLNVKLFGWQRYWLIHALEITPSGMFRFRTILTLISRQNGKTHLLKVLSLYLLYMGHARLILGAAQSLDLAREAWRGAVDMAEAVPDLREEIQQVLKSTVEYSIDPVSPARATGSPRPTTRRAAACRWTLLILDELRTHKDSAAWAALSNTTMARPNSLIIVAISNAGDDSSVVLNDLRAEALGQARPHAGHLRMVRPGRLRDRRPRRAGRQANPALGYAVTEQKLHLGACAPAAPKTSAPRTSASAWTRWTRPSTRRAGLACGDSELTLEDGQAAGVRGRRGGLRRRARHRGGGRPVGRGPDTPLEVLDAWASTQRGPRRHCAQLFARLAPARGGLVPGGAGHRARRRTCRPCTEEVIGEHAAMFLMDDDMRPEAPGVLKIDQVRALSRAWPTWWTTAGWCIRTTS
jgi:hypothetical protein